MKYNKYNEEDVLYCNNCLSLLILELVDTTLDICGDCGNVDIKELPFKEWEELYKGEKGHKFMEDSPPVKQLNDK